MAVSLKHDFQSAVADDADTSLVRPVDWNAEHELTLATDKLLGRDTAGAGVVEEIGVSGGIEFTGSGGIQTSAFTGDVTKSAGGTATTIANDAVTTAKIANSQVTLAKIANIATDRLLGRDTASSGVVEELTVGGGIEFSGSTGIQRSALTGDVTASAGSNSTTIANDAVTNAKMANMAQATIKGRQAGGGTGDPEDLTAAQGLTALGIGNVYSRWRIYTAGATWNKPSASNFTGVIAIAVGPGGGGGGTNTTNNRVGAGGGGGGWSIKTIAAGSLGSTETVTVGTGGSGGTTTGAGNAGSSASSFGSHCSGGAGNGGAVGTGSGATNGGTATGGDRNYDGGWGSDPGLDTDTYRGNGGSAGGANVSRLDPYLVNVPPGLDFAGAGARKRQSWEGQGTGYVGYWPGGGGSGGWRTSTSQTGAAGADGAVIVIEQYGT